MPRNRNRPINKKTKKLWDDITQVSSAKRRSVEEGRGGRTKEKKKQRIERKGREELAAKRGREEKGQGRRCSKARQGSEGRSLEKLRNLGMH